MYDTSVLALACCSVHVKQSCSIPWLATSICLHHLEPCSGIQSINKQQAIAISNTTSTATSSWQPGIQMVQQLEHQTIATCNLHSLVATTITYPAKEPTHDQITSQMVKQVTLWFARQQTQGQGHKEFPNNIKFNAKLKAKMPWCEIWMWLMTDKPKHGWVVTTWCKPWQYLMLPFEV